MSRCCRKLWTAGQNQQAVERNKKRLYVNFGLCLLKQQHRFRLACYCMHKDTTLNCSLSIQSAISCVQSYFRWATKRKRSQITFRECRDELHVTSHTRKIPVNLEACFFARISCNAKRAIHTKNDNHNNYFHKVLKITVTLKNCHTKTLTITTQKKNDIVGIAFIVIFFHH